MDIIAIIQESFINGWSYFFDEVTFSKWPSFVNYFWMLIIVSAGVYTLELLFPWRKWQMPLRKDFFLDLFYLFFNFIFFKLIFFGPFAEVIKRVFLNITNGGLPSLQLLGRLNPPIWLEVVLFFVILDFIQWAVHVALHRFNFLWQFHKLHHSVEEMGFAAHMRFHWMEHIVYTPAKYLVTAIIFGIEPSTAFITAYLATLIGHLNHANIKLTYGPLKYILNNPVMHLWHHSKKLPKGHYFGVNFGISLSLWDYLFKTAVIPEVKSDVKLGFHDMDTYPTTLLAQELYPFIKTKKSTEIE